MAASRGLTDVKRHLAALPAQIEQRVLRGAARAGGGVVLAEAKDRVASSQVRDALAMKARSEPGRIVVRITVPKSEQWARSVGIWLEYGTAPHFITVDDSQREGRTVRRINKLTAEGSLVIGGRFVGTTVHHPGARPHPFLRVSLDLKEAEAVAAAKAYVASRIQGGAIVGGDDEREAE